MQHLKADLQARGFILSPPASPEDLAALEADLGVPLPAPVRAMYELFDDLEDYQDLAYELLSIRRARAALAELRAPYENLGTPSLLRFGLPLFRDAGNNYLVYSMLHECPDRLVLSEHDMLFEPEVLFPTLTAVFEARCDPDTAALDFPPTYPVIAGTVPGDSEAADACIRAWRSRTGLEAGFFLSLACSVLPQTRLEELIHWLNEVAAEGLRPLYRSLGRREAPEAVPVLEALMHRVQTQGERFTVHTRWIEETIAEIGTPDARAALLRLNTPVPGQDPE
ncbi:hypothetical protein [Deinococcus sp. QL22]|uniref:hypothetical protein n=1 Tax=Deinococcus sp. QL22 TaxID=2939437 RepID=UPI0020173BFC|nr:hypothetical protein [Deinococcus sp. QL22]UQN06544.1 hypothetical protein M1R55_01080 [Deinococcus sp. QL22]